MSRQQELAACGDGVGKAREPPAEVEESKESRNGDPMALLLSNRILRSLKAKVDRNRRESWGEVTVRQFRGYREEQV